MKTRFQTLVALTVLLVGATLARAEDSKPVMVLSIPSYNDLIADADFLGGLVGASAGKMADGFITGMTQGKGLNGLDKTRSLAVIMNINNGEFSPVICLPVTNAKDLADVVSTLQGQGPAVVEDGVIKLSAPPPAGQVYIRDKSGWAYVTQAKDSPLPADPTTSLTGLSPEYDIAARVYLQNVPAEMKKSWIEKFHTFMEFAAQQQQSGDSPLAAISRKNMETQVNAIDQLLNQANEITVGWKLDRATKNTHFDVTFTAVPGSQLDQCMQQMAKAKTNFAGFIKPDAAATMNICGISTPENIEQSVTTLEQVKAKMEDAVDKDQNLPDDNARGQVKAALGKLIDVVEKTVKTGKMDGGAVLSIGPDQLQAAVGGYIADGPGFESAIKNLIELAKGEPEFSKVATVKFDVETYKEVRFHQISAKLPPDADDAAKKIFGDNVEIYVGIGPDSAYFSFGKGSLDLLKSVIDKSAAEPNKSVSPFQLSVALAPIFKFAAWANPNDPKSAMMAQAFESEKGKDHILVGAKVIPNGVTYRLDVEEGVLDAIGQASKMATQHALRAKAGPQPGNFPPAK